VHGPHDDKFYSLLREIEKDVKGFDWKRSKSHTLRSPTYAVASSSNKGKGKGKGDKGRRQQENVYTLKSSSNEHKLK
jgi:hypothetical protein